jgi:hypothetical protein
MWHVITYTAKLGPAGFFKVINVTRKECNIENNFNRMLYRGADKSLARRTSISIVFSVQGTGGSLTGPDPENRVGDQDAGNPGKPVSSGLQVPIEPFPSWSG